MFGNDTNERVRDELQHGETQDGAETSEDR